MENELKLMKIQRDAAISELLRIEKCGESIDDILVNELRNAVDRDLYIKLFCAISDVFNWSNRDKWDDEH